MFVWSIDRQCWLSAPPPGYGVTQPPGSEFTKIDEHYPRNILEEYTQTFVLKEECKVEVSVINGRTYINTTPHQITLQDEEGNVHVVPPSGVLINARAVEESAGGRDGVEFVRTNFVADEESARVLDELEQEYPGAFIISSIIAAQAFPGRVLAMVPAAGFERVPPAEKRMRTDKFTVF